MQAKKAVKRFGKKLIGLTIRTFQVGDHPGGLAKVTELYPEGKDDNIVMYVKGIEKQNAVEIGVFWDEEIEIV